MSTQPKQFITVEDYLKADREAERKSEYLNGEVFAMSGASWNHNLIALNILGEFRARLRNSPCTPVGMDFRLRVSATGLYTYPDVLVVCGPPMFAEEDPHTLLNPSLIIEVLSESTERYDRGKKFQHYRTLPTLTEYALVAQDLVRVEQYRRKESGWLLTEIADPEGEVRFDSIGCSLPIPEIYARVEFPG